MAISTQIPLQGVQTMKLYIMGEQLVIRKC